MKSVKKISTTITTQYNTMSASVSYKVICKGREEKDIEVRRFAMDKDATSFSSLKERLALMFPALKNTEMLVTWTDTDGDKVTIAGDEDLKIALNEMTGPVYKINLEVDQKKQKEKRNKEKKENMAGVLHLGVTCDGCEGPVVGTRFKCTVCPDFDLCSGCKAKDLHNNHSMAKMIAQVQDPLAQLGNLNRLMPEANRYQTRGCRGRRGTQNMYRGHCSPFLGPVMANRCTNQKSKKPENKKAECTKDNLSQTSAAPELQNGEEFFKLVGSFVADALAPFVVDMSPEEVLATHNKDKSSGDAQSEPAKDCDKEQPVQKDEKDTKDEGQAVAVEEGWTLYPTLPEKENSSTPTSADKPASSVSDKPASPSKSEIEEPIDPKLRVALEAMLNMGFTNEGGWLASLIEAKGGDIGKVLDLMKPNKN